MNSGDIPMVFNFIKWFKEKTDTNLMIDFEEFLREKSKKEDFDTKLVLKETAHAFGIEQYEILSPTRKRKIVDARCTAMVVMRSKGMTLTKIGLLLGGKDHATVIHGIKMFHDHYFTEQDYKQRADLVLKSFNVIV